jgi:hypothetical protein
MFVNAYGMIWYDIWYDMIDWYIWYDDMIDMKWYMIWYMIWYDMIYIVNHNSVDTRWQQYSTHLHTNSTQNNIMKQNTRNGTYITIIIHKHNNDTLLTNLNTSLRQLQPYVQRHNIEPKEYATATFIWSVYIPIMLDTLLLIHYSRSRFTYCHIDGDFWTSLNLTEAWKLWTWDHFKLDLCNKKTVFLFSCLIANLTNGTHSTFTPHSRLPFCHFAEQYCVKTVAHQMRRLQFTALTYV